MDRNNLGNGERIAGLSAILLFALMFFDWFGSKDAGELRLFSVGRSAWEALDYIPIILVIAMIVTLGTVTLRLTKSAYKFPVSPNAAVAILGMVSALLILFRIIDPPNFGSFRKVWGTIGIEGTVQLPIFLALVAAAGIAFGGFFAMREDGDSLPDLNARRHRGLGRFVVEDEPRAE